MARRTGGAGKIGSASTATSAPTPLGRRDRHLKVASAIWWRRFDVCLGNHQVGGRLVHAFLHNVSPLHAPGASWMIHSGSRSWEGPQSPRCQASVSTVNGTRITMIR